MVLGIGIVTIALDGFVLCAVANFLAFVPASVGPSCTLALVPSTDATTVTVLAGSNPLLFGVPVGATATLGPVGAPGSPLNVDGFTQILGAAGPLGVWTGPLVSGGLALEVGTQLPNAPGRSVLTIPATSARNCTITYLAV